MKLLDSSFVDSSASFSCRCHGTSSRPGSSRICRNSWHGTRWSSCCRGVPRVTGGSTLTAKLKVRGTGLRPMLRAMIDDAPALAFVFEDPHSADVLVGEVPAGAHDLILFDGVQEVARTRRAVTIQSER